MASLSLESPLDWSVLNDRHYDSYDCQVSVVTKLSLEVYKFRDYDKREIYCPNCLPGFRGVCKLVPLSLPRTTFDPEYVGPLLLLISH